MTWAIVKIDNSQMLSIIEQKMCSDDRKVWSRDLECQGEKATLERLMNWMDVEMKSRMRTTAPLRSSRSVCAFQVDTPKQKWCKCWYCKSSSHWSDSCPKFAALDIDQRIKVAKENCRRRRREGNACIFINHCFTRALQFKLSSRLSPSHMKLFCR